MVEKNDYTNLSLEELVKKQKSLSNWRKIFIAATVFLVASALYAIYMKSKMHPFWLLGALFSLFYIGSKLKKIEAEIENRKN